MILYQQYFSTEFNNCFHLENVCQYHENGAIVFGKSVFSKLLLFSVGPKSSNGNPDFPTPETFGTCQFGSVQCSGSKPSSTRTPGLVKALSFFLYRESESGYYRVSSHYYPEDSEKLAVKASSLVFVVARGADGWATAIHDGQVRKMGGLSSPSPPAETTALAVNRSLLQSPEHIPWGPTCSTAEQRMSSGAHFHRPVANRRFL